MICDKISKRDLKILTQREKKLLKTCETTGGFCFAITILALKTSDNGINKYHAITLRLMWAWVWGGGALGLGSLAYRLPKYQLTSSENYNKYATVWEFYLSELLNYSSLFITIN
jgi:hypothetical protein